MQDQAQDSCPDPTAQIVIVNWNSGPWLQACLRSISDFGGGAVDRVIVVDNGSKDGSAEVDVDGINLEVRQTDANLGFAKACNLGAAGATAPYLLFLNPDAALRPGALQMALAFMAGLAGRRTGVCGVRLIGEDGLVQQHTTKLPNPFSLLNLTLLRTPFDHLSSRPVGHVIGAFYLIRRELFERLGGFDERFFVYLEDLDLSVRVHDAGWAVHYLAEAISFHKGGGTSEQVKAHRLYYSLQSRILYAFKHFSAPSAWLVLAATISLEPAARFLRALARTSRADFSHTAQGYRMLLRALPTIVRTALGAKRVRDEV